MSACYATLISTFVFTATFTTTDVENLPHTVTSTITTASTPSVPTLVASNTAPNGVVAKVTPTATAIAKTSPIRTSTANGLTKSQLGGIIGGAVALLAALILATFLIIRRLNKVVKATTASQSRIHNSFSGRYSRKQGPSASEVDTMSIDPLMIIPSEASRSVRHPFRSSLVHDSAHEVDGSSSSPHGFGGSWSPQSLPFNHYPRGYNPVPTSDSRSSSGHRRGLSAESTPPTRYDPHSGYFDSTPDLRDQNLRFGHYSPPPRRPSQHQRNLSDESNQSEVSAGSSSIAELEAGTDGGRRLSLQRAWQGFALGRLSTRRKISQSNPSPTTLGGGPSRKYPEWPPGSSFGLVGLGHIPEAGESRVVIPELREEMR